MTTVFIATMSFSMGLLAFCAGAWLTVWSSNTSNQYAESAAAKLSGYFITVLAIVSLVFTSYFLAQTIMTTNHSKQVVTQNKGKVKHMAGKQHTNKTQHSTNNQSK